ncbi:MAG: polyribonucleotide nucleotidyltransferase [Candidatus Comchoanobacterales bacterium]
MSLSSTAFSKSFTIGNDTITLSTGSIAKHADGAVMAQMGDTVILATVTFSKKPTDADFFPLGCHYMEKFYASGKIPGGYFKREGRPTERETLISRLIDRPIRPLFDKNFNHETQVTATLMSYDPNYESDIVALIASSAALCISGAPFNGPIGAVRVGQVDGQWVLNPSAAVLNDSNLDLVVAGTQNAILMVESEAKELPESAMCDALAFGHDAIADITKHIQDFAAETHNRKDAFQLSSNTADTIDLSPFQDQIRSHLFDDKSKKAHLNHEIVASVLEKNNAVSEDMVHHAIHQLESQLTREHIITNKSRSDGRDLTTVRNISIQLGLLPKAHGSAVFTRGGTQALVVSTLGSDKDALKIDDITSEGDLDRFMLHYNFPPYSVGECGSLAGPKRREVGHGRLAKRAIVNMLPDQNEFPYVIRTVSEITESNGSSSMATVCGTTLSLMDAGVPIKKPVAGVAMGLIMQNEQYAILTDILGSEDHIGDMDFKVAGTENGITALQMDIKIQGITQAIMTESLAQAREARLHILNEMTQVISQPRASVASSAPKVCQIKINPDKISTLIGKGGATIKGLIEKYKVSIDVDDHGHVKIMGTNSSDAENCLAEVEKLTMVIEVGQILEGKVVKIVDFGAFINLTPGQDGLLHISEIKNERIESVSDHLSEGETIKVKVIGMDPRNRTIKLSMKNLRTEINC